MSNNNDLRVKRTKKMIVEAFICLIRQKSLDKISIQEIAEHAMINRATFYAHYADKQDLYDSLIDDFLIRFSQILDEKKIIDGTNVYVSEIEALLARFYDFARENPEVAQMIMDKSLEKTFVERFFTILSARYDELFQNLEIQEHGMEVPIDFVATYIASMLVGTLTWWVQSDTSISSRYFAHLMIKLISNGHLTVLGVNINRD